jgi:hypothetical protein
VRALKGGVPRAYACHKGPMPYRYREVALELLARCGQSPPDALVLRLIKAIARMTVELDQVRRDQTGRGRWARGAAARGRRSPRPGRLAWPWLQRKGRVPRP